jgi:hypothetical protein
MIKEKALRRKGKPDIVMSGILTLQPITDGNHSNPYQYYNMFSTVNQGTIYWFYDKDKETRDKDCAKIQKMLDERYDYIDFDKVTK